MGTTELGFYFNQADMWFNPRFLPFDSFVSNSALFGF